ncbi:MAG: mechanosensitive ion channel [Saprospiraceae bacterium]
MKVLYSIYQIIKYTLWVIIIGVILNVLGFNSTLMLAGVSCIISRIRSGIQHIFNDYVSGILLLFEHNVRIGDIMEIENDKVGRVLKIGLRTSKIKYSEMISLLSFQIQN